MKKLSLFLALLMMLSCISGAFAEAPAAPDEATLLAQNCEFALIEANGDQPRLTYIEGVTPILDIDGLKFKDMNKNGKLDVYEDYRQDIDARVDDLLSQLDYAQKAGLLFCVSANLKTARALIPDFNLSCMLFNLNGLPVQVTNTLNNLQAAAEKEPFGIPMTFTSDREYNSFGGYIDKSHEGFGTAYDPELAYKLAKIYGEAMVAIGIHVTFEPYANEIGAQYGENPELIAAVVHNEVKGLEDAGFASCVKHWIGRGGDSSFEKARSVAQNFDNWMVGWKAALSGGAEWVMTNCDGTGITNTVDPKWDSVTMGYLRNELGFDGIVVTDWWALRATQTDKVPTPEGVMLPEQSFAWLYNEALRLGTDVFGAGSISHGSSREEVLTRVNGNWPDVIVEGLKTGEVDIANVDRSAGRVLKFKFKKGLFENPYKVIDEMLAVVASPEYQANPDMPVTTNEDLRAARRQDEVALTEELQAKSAVLVKNDNNLLPLKAGTKIYIESSNSDALVGYKKYLPESGFVVVEDIAEADVVIGDFASINDTAEMLIDDAEYFGKPLVLTLNNTDPTEYAIRSADAIIYMSYNHKADHGSTMAGFVLTTEPWIYADLISGARQPGGVIVKELARDPYLDGAQWKDLAGDQGADPYVRLMVQGAMLENENHASPNNWGDPLVQALYGMEYGKAPEFEYSCMILPFVTTMTETVNSRGRVSRTITNTNQAMADEPFTVYCLIRNLGADGITNVQVKANGEVVADKIMTVCGGSWRVFQCDIALDAGTYTIDIGGQTQNITIVKGN